MQAAVEEETERADGYQGPLRIVLVEDSRAVVAALSEQLNELPNVIVVGNTDSEQGAVELLGSTEYDVVILDIQLRLGTGIGVLRTLARLPEPARKHTAMIYSNYAEGEYRAAAARFGARYFFDKTADTQSLLATVAQLAE
ncbi:MAG: response regulator [Gammaproteobacteria bacterium]